MLIEIWSDVMCPFCYIGKRHFEAALQRFEHRDEVEVTWRSFQLAPGLPRVCEGDVHDYLAAKYGGGRERAKAMNDDMAARAAQVGLTYNFDSAVLGNTFDAHRLAHMARAAGVEDAAVERVFRAYFTDSLAVSDPDVLARLGADVGLDADAVRAMLASDEYVDAVQAEADEALTLGIQGVPCFVIDRRFAVSGAQPPELILEALERAWEASSAKSENTASTPSA
jgi:predicted DsbA family dithiol-disulfide isomerase